MNITHRTLIVGPKTALHVVVVRKRSSTLIILFPKPDHFFPHDDRVQYGIVELFMPAVLKYLDSTLNLVCNNKCIVDDYYGVCAFLNIVPLLYHIGTWKISHSVPQFRKVLAAICMIVMNICHWITPPSGEDRFDAKPSLVDLPATVGARIYIERIITDEDDDNSTRGSWRKELLESHPKSFAITAGLEVLGWYSYNGVAMNTPVPVSSGPPIDVSEAIEEYESNIVYLIRRHPDLQYIEPILTALIHKRKAPKPNQARSLLHGPLCSARRRCGLPSCRNPQVVARCSGCGGMEYYCSKDHQRQHWTDHKPICKKH